MVQLIAGLGIPLLAAAVLGWWLLRPGAWERRRLWTEVDQRAHRGTEVDDSIVATKRGQGSPRQQFFVQAAWAVVVILHSSFSELSLLQSAAVWVAVAACLLLLHGHFDALVGRAHRINRLRTRVANHDRQICPDCLYSLQDLPEHGNCPECGHTYAMATVRQYWDKLLTLYEQVPSHVPLRRLWGI